MHAWTTAYRKLVVAEESLAGTEQALKLLQTILGGTIDEQNDRIALSFAGKTKVVGMNGWLTDAATALNLGKLHQAAHDRARSSAHRKRTILVRQTALHLALTPLVAAHLEPALSARRFSLLNDVGLVLFHQACFGLLPELGASWLVERQALFTAFEWFAERQPRAADRFQVLALTHHARGNAELAAQYFQEVVAATPAEDHDFMTCVQAAWSCLVEQGQYENGFNFLLRTMPRVTLADQEELQAMMQQTFQLVAHPAQHTAPLVGK